MVLLFLQFYLRRLCWPRQFPDHFFPRPVRPFKSASRRLHDRGCACGKFSPTRWRLAIGQDRRIPGAHELAGRCRGMSDGSRTAAWASAGSRPSVSHHGDAWDGKWCHLSTCPAAILRARRRAYRASWRGWWIGRVFPAISSRND